MGHDDRREIFERLEALERMVRSRAGEHGRSERHHDDDFDRHHRGHRDDDHRHRGHRDRHDDHHRHDRGEGRRGDEFEEKRIIDTVVRLVVERVGRLMQDQQARTQRRDGGGDEKRIIDLVVRLVGEQVREIVQEVVAAELDRRLPRSSGPTDDPDDR